MYIIVIIQRIYNTVIWRERERERGREGNYNNIKYSDISSNTAADFPGLTFNPPLQHRIKNKSFPLSREISKERD